MGMPAGQSNSYQRQQAAPGGPAFAQLLQQMMQRPQPPQMQRPQQPQPQQGMGGMPPNVQAIMQQMQQRGLFARPVGPEQGMNRFLHMGNPQMPQQQIPPQVQQMQRMMFQRPQPPNPAAGLFGPQPQPEARPGFPAMPPGSGMYDNFGMGTQSVGAGA